MVKISVLDETKLTRPLRTTLVATSRREEATSGLDVMFTISFFVRIYLLFHPRPKSLKSWLQHALEKA